MTLFTLYPLRGNDYHREHRIQDTRYHKMQAQKIERTREALRHLIKHEKECRLCPRECGVNRSRRALNINLVSPTHLIVPILKALKSAYEQGLRLPLVYNSNGYEKVEVIKRLAGIVDIYLPDLKYFSTRSTTPARSSERCIANSQSLSVMNLISQRRDSYSLHILEWTRKESLR